MLGPSDPSQTSSPLPEERDLRIEQSVLSEIIDLHPDHLSQDELILRMEDCPKGTDRIAILDTLRELKRSGLIRLNGEVVEATFPALRTAEIFECP
jgi:hypothetical protein